MFQLPRYFFSFYILICISFSFIQYNYGQAGDPFITNYFVNTAESNNNWAIIQDNEEIMLFANRNGLLSFDGTQWNSIPTPDVPYALYNDTIHKTIYIGCRNNFGYIKKDSKGVYHYQPISSNYNGFGNIRFVGASGKYILFYSSNAVFKVDREDYSNIKAWNHRVSEPFSGFIILNGNSYVNVEKLGLHRLSKNNITPVAGGEFLSGLKILFFIDFDPKHVLFGTSDNKLYLYDGNVFLEYKTNVDEYLAESVISGGLSIDANGFAIATVTGGCVIINKKEHKSNYLVNYQTGLPDDEIYALGLDNKGGIWASHEYGFSRIDMSLPIRKFSNYPGLVGNLISMIQFDSTIYVSTSEGVFYLDKVNDYKEIEVLVKSKEQEKPTHINKEETSFTLHSTKISESIENMPKEQKSKRNIFKRIFSKNRNKKSTDSESDKTTIDADKQPETQKEVKEQISKSPVRETFKSKKIYAIQSVRYIYKKVKDLNEKSKQLIISNNSLLTATNTGVFEIIEHCAIPVVRNCYVNQIAHSRNPKRLFVGTSSGLLSLVFNQNNWIVERNFPDFQENVYTLIEDDRHHLWIGGENTVYDIFLDKSYSPVMIKPYLLQGSNSEFVLVRSVFGKPFFFLSNGIYSYDEKTDTIYYNEKTNRDFKSNSRFIFSQENITWIYEGHSWTSLNRLADLTSLDETYLELFDDIQNIYVDDNKNIWVIDGNNDLYNILPFTNRSLIQYINVYIHQISDQSGRLFSISALELDYEHNSISFQISAPYYLKEQATKYQYIVEGLMKKWSQWTINPNVELPFIPPGKYKFRVRAKNILGQLSKEKSFIFKIVPPFWNSWWFYSLCALVSLFLFYGLLKIREGNLKRSKKLLEEKVRLRTVQLEQEKEKSDKLLLNILPSETAEELKSKGKATARHYNLVSVMFSDFKGFTSIAENIKAESLVLKLDECFIKFDEIIERYKLEKIKTIGDAYMCAGGIPIENQENPLLILLAAIEIREFMKELKDRKKDEKYWELRLGIHTGPLIAGVVGKKKFAYDIWGDTVNTARRMESSSIPGKINISGATYNLVKRYFECEYRGKIEAKNKGKIDMYFINRIKPEYSADEKGLTPNDLFKEILKLT